MRQRAWLAVLASALLIVSCRPVVTTPDVTIINTLSGDQVAPNPTGSPSPGTGGPLPEGSRIRIGIFGQSCPPGVTVPLNGQGQIKVGCVADITATPKYADGTDIPATIHGSVITWQYISGNGTAADCRAGVATEFNRICVGRSPGLLILQATVKNVTGVAEIQVIGLAGGASQAFRGW